LPSAAGTKRAGKSAAKRLAVLSIARRFPNRILRPAIINHQTSTVRGASDMFHRPLLALTLSALAAFAAHAAGDPAKGQPLGSTLCAGCHGADGHSLIPGYPHLAAQVPQYMAKQLRDFKATAGKPAARKNDIMAGMVMALNDDDMQNLAAYFAAMPAKAGTPRAGADLELGKRIWEGGIMAKGVAACAGCHGPAGHGLPALYPGLAAQAPDYAEAQLKAFRASERANDPEATMRMIAERLNDAEIRAVSDYAASLR
jgi:cytochrome c553